MRRASKPGVIDLVGLLHDSMGQGPKTPHTTTARDALPY